MKKAVILFSGGLDSTTCLAMAQKAGFECYTLSFAYGQKHGAELQVAKDMAKAMAVQSHRVVQLDINQFGGSALTDDNLEVPDYESSNKIPLTYVPARNTIFLSYALALAEVERAFNIFIGVNALDYSGYPDCRPEYIEAFQTMGRLATKSGIEEKEQLQIHTPLIEMTKSEIIQTGMMLGVDYSKTHSCYDPIGKGYPCGRCDACQLRLKGFMEAGAVDPLNYPKIQQ